MTIHQTGADSDHAVIYHSAAIDGSCKVYDGQYDILDNISTSRATHIGPMLKNHQTDFIT